MIFNKEYSTKNCWHKNFTYFLFGYKNRVPAENEEKGAFAEVTLRQEIPITRHRSMSKDGIREKSKAAISKDIAAFDVLSNDQIYFLRFSL